MSFDPTKVPVVLLTGASGALGSAIASAYSEQGATLVLQDIPEAKDKLETLANDLRSKYNNIISTTYINIRSDPAALVNFTLQTFGYLSVLINNAGFLLDKSFSKLNDLEWNDIIDIHLNVPYKLTRAAWPIFNQQKFGRVLFVTSHAGLFGNFGQSNYSSAKAAVTGLTKTLALEGKKNGIMVNAIAPFAMSKMTESAFPKEMLTAFDPREIAPVVLFLTNHDNTSVTGEVLQCGGGWVARTVVYTGPGVVFKTGDAATTPINTKISQLKHAWPQLQSLPKLPDPASDSHGQNVFAKTADQVFAEMMRLVRHSHDELQSQGTISKSPSQQVPSSISASSKPSPSPSSVPSPSSAPSPSPSSAPSASVAPSKPSGLKSEALFRGLEPHLDPDIVKSAGVVIGFEISPGSPQARTKGSAAQSAAASGPKKTVTIDLKNGKGAIVWDQLLSAESKKPDATLIIHDDLLVKLFLQEVEAQSLYLTGKIKVRGDIAKAMKFEQVLKSFENKVSVKDLLASAHARL